MCKLRHPVVLISETGAFASESGASGRPRCAPSDAIAVAAMECSSSLGRCAGWLCGKTGFASPGENNNAAVAGHNTLSGDRPASPVIEIMHGPGPSPGSSGSCDDSQPPLKNCYRLVMLG